MSSFFIIWACIAQSGQTVGYHLGTPQKCFDSNQYGRVSSGKMGENQTASKPHWARPWLPARCHPSWDVCWPVISKKLINRSFFVFIFLFYNYFIFKILILTYLEIIKFFNFNLFLNIIKFLFAIFFFYIIFIYYLTPFATFDTYK